MAEPSNNTAEIDRILSAYFAKESADAIGESDRKGLEQADKNARDALKKPEVQATYLEYIAALKASQDARAKAIPGFDPFTASDSAIEKAAPEQRRHIAALDAVRREKGSAMSGAVMKELDALIPEPHGLYKSQAFTYLRKAAEFKVNTESRALAKTTERERQLEKATGDAAKKYGKDLQKIENLLQNLQEKLGNEHSPDDADAIYRRLLEKMPMPGQSGNQAKRSPLPAPLNNMVETEDALRRALELFRQGDGEKSGSAPPRKKPSGIKQLAP